MAESAQETGAVHLVAEPRHARRTLSGRKLGVSSRPQLASALERSARA